MDHAIHVRNLVGYADELSHKDQATLTGPETAFLRGIVSVNLAVMSHNFDAGAKALLFVHKKSLTVVRELYTRRIHNIVVTKAADDFVMSVLAFNSELLSEATALEVDNHD